jgi:outer membrane protein OmpA-like peptidoglycan-associated protein
MPGKEAFMPKKCPALPTSAPAQPKASAAAYLLLCGVLLALGSATASAEELSHDEMVCALDPQCVMPVVNRRLRGITATPNVSTPGSFDRTINFAFDSAELTPEARSELDKVAAVLTDRHIEKYTIIIHGHTDDIGTVEYNQSLSERRAEAARKYFITQHGIDPSRLIAKGHGKSQLLLPADPTNALNRRVQFENANYAAASVPPVAPHPIAPTPTPPVAPPSQAATPPSGDGDGL